MTNYIVNPYLIEEKSMEIIESIMKNPAGFSKIQLPVIKRVIHTTADFEYEQLIKFNGEVISKALKYLKEGCQIYTDTSMIKAGVNKTKLASLNCELCNYVHDDDIKKIAKEQGITRSMAAIEKAYFNKNIKIFAIGNAPTALFKLLELCNQYTKETPIIIGVPVGFVGAAESKQQLANHKHIPYITVEGRKGGSTVTVAIINALLKQIK
ncbi:precorrin-8X methylmutase [Clostridium sp. 'deep sea']|uniref:precorrin-8X methylmutase n=1 Tax=Clostridium sp. 'deep sea' TaxID=2779445 RepID=UPI0018965B06|nr:precorrin-8X methylmutase [Clostridium sp. 'deep sea']QOR36736.1 precorrin-8X methylmutase [Clostridium sp. 'deep sea']